MNNLISWRVQRKFYKLQGCQYRDKHIGCWFLSKKYSTPRFDKIEWCFHCAAITSLISETETTVNYFLGWVFLLSLVKDGWNSFNTTNCWKSIVRKTWTLIFDWAHCSIRYPINIETNRRSIQLAACLKISGCRIGWKICLFEFLLSKSSKLVNSHGVSFF